MVLIQKFICLIPLQIATENASLTKKIHDLEDQLGEQRTEVSLLQGDQEDILKDARMNEQSQKIEILTLRKACEMQKDDIEELTNENRKSIQYNQELVQKHQEDMLRIEEEFNEERTTLREQLHEVRKVIISKYILELSFISIIYKFQNEVISNPLFALR